METNSVQCEACGSMTDTVSGNTVQWCDLCWDIYDESIIAESERMSS